MDAALQQRSVGALSRAAKRSGSDALYDRLRSCLADAAFVRETLRCTPAYRALPVAANLRCGMWYAGTPDIFTLPPAHFKSTDGHTSHWRFSTARLNLHVATAAAERGGVALVDATTRGKTFPDALTKTVPMWCATLNVALRRLALREAERGQRADGDRALSERQGCETGNDKHAAAGDAWDTAIHLPPWLPASESGQIAARLEGWADELLEVAAPLLEPLLCALQRPLRCLWVGQLSSLIVNEHHGGEGGLDALPFTPIVCVSASMPVADAAAQAAQAAVLAAQSVGAGTAAGAAAASDQSWLYVPGAGDDEESWARLGRSKLALTAGAFWANSERILAGGRAHCEAEVAKLLTGGRCGTATGDQTNGGAGSTYVAEGVSTPTRLGDSGLLLCGAAGAIRSDIFEHVDAMLGLTCSEALAVAVAGGTEPTGSWRVALLRVPGSKREGKARRPGGSTAACDAPESLSLREAMPRALALVRAWRTRGVKRVLLWCDGGVDVCVCAAAALALAMPLPLASGTDASASAAESLIDDPKVAMRRAAAAVCALYPRARPSRPNLKAARLGVEDALGLNARAPQQHT